MADINNIRSRENYYQGSTMTGKIATVSTMTFILWIFPGISPADVWEDLASYEYGDNTHAGEKAEELIKKTSPDQYGRLEEKLIGVVSSDKATQTGKAIACRMLQRVGSKECIPAISGLLADKILSHYARLVLERLECEEADKAMRDAIEKAPDVARIGILGSLGERGDRKTVEIAGKLAASNNPALARAAIKALGRIGGKDAAGKLLAINPSDKTVDVRMQAMVECASGLEGREPVYLCRKVLDGYFSPCRIAALRVLAVSAPSEAATLISGAIRGDDAALREGAFGIVVETEGETLTTAMVRLLDDLSGKRKAALVTALGSRGDKAAINALITLAKSDDKTVSDPAARAISRIGDAETINTLLELASSPDTGEMIVTAIKAMNAEGIDKALIEALCNDRLRNTAIRALAGRGCTTAVPAMLELLESDDPNLRREAWNGIADLASGKDVEAVIKKAASITDENELPCAEKAITKLCARAKNKPACFATIAKYYDGLKDSTKSTIFKLISSSGDKNSLEMARKGLKSDNKDLAGDALRSLVKWPNASASDYLLKLAKTGTGTSKILALQGYIHIAGLETSGLSGGERTEMFRTALELAERNDEKRLVVAGLRNAISTEAVEILERLMEDENLAGDAELSAANLAWKLRMTGNAKVKALAKKLSGSDNDKIANDARKTLKVMSEKSPYIRGWLISPVYDADDCKSAFDKTFAPEQEGTDISWSILTAGIGREKIDLKGQLGDRNNCAVYLKTTLVSDRAQSVSLEMGSDDAIKAWLNGKLVHDNYQNRGCSPGQDKVTVKLKEGDNPLLLKIAQGNGGFEASCRVKTGDGKNAEGLSVKLE